MTKWEYKVHALSPATAKDSEAELNELGKQGWELAAADRPSDGITYRILIFKRPVGPPPFK
jgi:hypothetical protein